MTRSHPLGAPSPENAEGVPLRTPDTGHPPLEGHLSALGAGQAGNTEELAPPEQTWQMAVGE